MSLGLDREMHCINSAWAGARGGLVHTAAEFVIVLGVLLLGFETVTFCVSRRKRQRAALAQAARTSAKAAASLPAPTPSPAAAPAAPAAQLAPKATPLAEPKATPLAALDDDQGSSLDVPQVFLFCQDGIEPDETTLPSPRILLRACGDSDAGKKRAQNEDSFLLFPDHGLFAVADGMGGYHGGQVASSLAVDTLKRAFELADFDGEFQSDAPIPRRGRELATALVQANRAVFSAARSAPGLSEMGTTMVAARFSPNKRRVYIGHVGDSRCYRLRGATLTQLTTDHTMRHLGLEGPHANDLFRALGIEQNVVIDLVTDIPRSEDIYLLCSDGLPKMVSDEQIANALLSEDDLEAALYRLIELANDAGGRDNVTVILVRVRERQLLALDLFEASKGLVADSSQQSVRKTLTGHAPEAGDKLGSSR